jgi:AraC family transcriptional regulator
MQREDKMTSIKLFRGAFGHVSVLNAARDLVTHAHPEAHAIVWLCGNPGKLMVGETPVEIGPGTAVCINSFQPHSHSFESGETPGSFLAFYIEPEWLRSRLPHGERIFASSAVVLDQRLRNMIDSLLERFISFNDPCLLDAYEAERRIGELINAFEAAPAATAPSALPPVRIDYRIRKAIQLMNGNVAGRIGLDEVARSAGLSRPHFFALFKTQMQVTPNVFWNALRMKEALRQIEDSDESLTEVACNLGFTTQGNFTRFFRDHAGVPPALYREAARSAA